MNCLRRNRRWQSKRLYWEGPLGGEWQGEGNQEGCSAMGLTILGVTVTGLVSRLSLADHSYSELFLVAYASSVEFTSVTQSCPVLCNPVDYSMPGFPVHHQLPELTQTHVHWVGDAIQPSHPLLSLSPPAFSVSKHQGLFQWVSSSHQVTKVLASISPSNEYSGQISLQLTGLISLQSKGLSRVFSSTTVQKHQFFGVQLSL